MATKIRKRKVQRLAMLAAAAFGIFALNGAYAASVSDQGDTADWTAVAGKQMSSFGRFDLVLKGDGNSRTSLLTFSIDGIDGDTIIDDVALSSGRSASPKVDFAAHIAGFSFDNGEAGTIDSAFFGGSKPDTGVVPVPSAVWFFGSAIGLLAIIRRERATA